MIERQENQVAEKKKDTNLTRKQGFNGLAEEKIAGNKSNAHAVKSGSHYEATSDNSKAVHSNISDSITKTSENVSVNPRDRSEHHDVVNNPSEKATHWEAKDGSVLNDISITAKDTLGRSLDASEIQSGIQRNPDTKPSTNIPEPEEQNITSVNTRKGLASENKNGKGLVTAPVQQEEQEEGNGLLRDGRTKTKEKDLGLRWTSRKQKSGAGQRVAQSVKDTVKQEYDNTDVAKGQREAKEKAKKFIAISGVKPLARAGIKSNVKGEMYHSHTVTRFSNDDKIEEEETLHAILESNPDLKGYVTGIDNSYGNVVKDLRNNLNILDKYFQKHDIDFTGWTQKDFDKALKTGKIKNKAGKDIDIRKNPEMRALFAERVKSERRKQTLKRMGTWKDEVSDLASSTYSETDAMQGYTVVKNMHKAVDTGVTVAGAVNAGVANTGITAVGGVRRAVNNVKNISAKAHIVSGKIRGKDVSKWQVRSQALRNKNISIKMADARRKSVVRDKLSHPNRKVGKAAVNGIKKLNSKIWQKTLGKTKFGKALAEFVYGNGDDKTGIAKAFGRLSLRLTSHRGPVAAIARGISNIRSAISKLLLRVIALCLALILCISGVVVVVDTVASIFPASGESSMDNASNTTATAAIWDNAKASMQNELSSIAADVSSSFLPSEHKALLEKAYNFKMNYSETFIFSGFEFQGTDNLICQGNGGRDIDPDATPSTSTVSTADMQTAENNSASYVSDKKTAAKGPYSGQNGSLTKSMGRNMHGPSGQETYYNMDMANCVHTLDLHCRGKNGLSKTAHYFVRKDGVKMYGDENGIAYVMVAANLSLRPKGSIVMTSLGPGIVADTGGFASTNPTQLDIAVTWGSQYGGTASGTVDTWGAGSDGSADLAVNGATDDGVKANSYNYFRAILAMATAATENEDNPDHQDYYNKYCCHLIDNSYNYTKYLAAKYWQKEIQSNPYYGRGKYDTIYYDGPADENEDDFGIPADGGPSAQPKYKGYGISVSMNDELNQFGAGDLFRVSVLERSFRYYTTPSGQKRKALTNITYAVSMSFKDCGLWGDNQIVPENPYTDTDYTDDGTRAGQISRYRDNFAGMFDLEEYEYTCELPSGGTTTNELGTDEFMHSIGGGDDVSEAYSETDPSSSGYEEWEGYQDDGSVGDGTIENSGTFIYESGGMASLAEASYELSDEDLQEEKISMFGIFNVNNTGESNGGATANKLSETEIQSILNNVSGQISDKDSKQRINAVEAALRLVGTATYNMNGPGPNMHGVAYTSGRGKDHIKNYPSDYGEWKSQSDCSGYVSYILYKSGAKSFTNKSASDTGGLIDGGKKVSGSPRPGDIYVKYNGTVNGHHDCHVVMYIGSTSYGKFTIVECTTRSGQSGPQIRGYSSETDFWNKRGSDYKNKRNYFGD